MAQNISLANPKLLPNPFPSRKGGYLDVLRLNKDLTLIIYYVII
jgi:hypothetical protein